MLHLMNSAMMPQDGRYECKKITAAEAKRLFQEHMEKPLSPGRGRAKFRSYIGYPQAARVLSALLGVEVPVSRHETVLENGDLALVMKLRYRVNPTAKKNNTAGHALADYQFCVVQYHTF